MTPSAGDADRTFAPVIRTQADLETAWRDLIRPLGFHRISVWLMMIQPDGVPLPQLIEIADLPSEPTRADADALAAMLAHQPVGAADGGRWALLRSRPGCTPLEPDDRRWATTVHAACAAAGVALATLHVATDVDISPVPLDELQAVS